MPIFEPSVFESNKFKEPLKDCRVIQRSEWLYEFEIPLRDDMIPGCIMLKEYGNRYCVSIEMLAKKFPKEYLHADEFKQKGSEGHVYMDRKTHERWLKKFCREKDVAGPTPEHSPKFFGKVSEVVATEPLVTPCHPNMVSREWVRQHPSKGKIKDNLGEVRSARTALDITPSDRQIQSQYVQKFTDDDEVQRISDEPIEEGELEPELVGSSSTAMEVFTREQMLSWPAKRLANRRTRLGKMQWRAQRAGRRHQVQICQQQLELVDAIQQERHWGKYFEPNYEETQSRQASAEAKSRGTLPSLRRPQIPSKVSGVSTVSNHLPRVPKRRKRIGSPPVLPPKFMRKISSDSFDLFESDSEFQKRNTVYSNVHNEHLLDFENKENMENISKTVQKKPKKSSVRNLSNKNRVKNVNKNVVKNKNVRKNRCKNVCNKNVHKNVRQNKNISNQKSNNASNNVCSSMDHGNKVKPERFDINIKNNSRTVKTSSFSSRKRSPVYRPKKLVSVKSDEENEELGFPDIWSEESPEFSDGSPNDPKIYLGGRFSDQSSPDSPRTAAMITGRALWYEPCTRREYAYKVRAYRAEGRPERPTNSPIGFFLPPSRRNQHSYSLD